MSILDNLSVLRVRVVYHGMPEVRNSIVELLHQQFADAIPANRYLYQNERSVVDVDAIATSLRVSIEEVLQKKVFVINQLPCELNGVDIFVSDNFFVLSFKDLQAIQEGINLNCYARFAEDVISQVLYPMIEGKNISVLLWNYYLYAPLIVDKEGFSSVYNQTYWPSLTNDLKTARYVERTVSNGIASDVVRDVEFGRMEDSDYKDQDVYCTGVEYRGEISKTKVGEKPEEGMIFRLTDEALNVSAKYYAK